MKKNKYKSFNLRELDNLMIWVFIKDRTTMLPKKFKDAKLEFDRVINFKVLFFTISKKIWLRLQKEPFLHFHDH